MDISLFDFEALKKKHLSAQANSTTSIETFKLIAGDASDRKFYRLSQGKSSAICMWFPKWQGGYGGDPISWLQMHAAFAHVELPVPQVLKVDEKNSCIWTEDFGDSFLNEGINPEEMIDHRDSSQEKVVERYKQAIDLLVHAQFPKIPYPDNPALHRYFDFEKLNFEMEFFYNHFCNKWLNLDMDGALVSQLKNELIDVCENLGKRKQVICHRDYHVRNIMLVNGTAKWIDFQDARVGPMSYDLVSLVRDSYIKMKNETRHFFYQYYFAEAKARPNFSESYENLLEEINMMGIQRNIKALGSFAYLALEKGKSDYLKYVFNTLSTLLEEFESRENSISTRYPHTHKFLSELRHGSLQTNVIKKCEAFGVRA